MRTHGGPVGLVHFVRGGGAFCTLVAVLFSGCATPNTSTSRSVTLQPDQDDGLGGSFLERGDIRSIAVTMTGELLSTPEIAGGAPPVRIAVAPIMNSTRFVIDKALFTKRLRLELNKNASAKVRFLSQGTGQGVRREMLAERDEDQWDAMLNDVAAALLGSPVVGGRAGKPMHVALIPVRNTNMVGLNGDSFTALMRAKVASQSGGRVVFLAREGSGKALEQLLAEADVKDQGLATGAGQGKLQGVEYFLTAEFIGKSMRVEAPTKTTETKVEGTVDGGVAVSKVTRGQAPNVEKLLNVQLIDAVSGAVPFEKLVRVERKMKSGVGRAAYLLTGELSGLSKAVGGNRSDYILMSFQLVDPETNEILWENGYETKKVTSVSGIYK